MAVINRRAVKKVAEKNGALSKCAWNGRHGADVAKTDVLSHGDKTMQYMLLIHTDEAAMKSAMETGGAPKMMGAYMAYTQAMKEAGVLKAGDALQPSASATVVRVRDGKTAVLDGPYAEAKEQLGGYYLIDTPNLDGALEWAARCPGAALGAIEVRPVVVFAPA